MRRLLLLIYRFRAFMLFLVLEMICMVLISSKSAYHRVAFNHSSNAIVGSVMSIVGKAGDFFNQGQQVEDLSHRVAELTTELEELKQKERQFFLSHLDDSKIYQFKYVPAKVVKNSLYKPNNYITIDKGTAQGIKPGMGVISTNGVIGRVKSCSDDFSTVISFLHSQFKVSARIKRSKILCYATWTGANPKLINIFGIPRHEKVLVGDTIETSGFGAIFPEGMGIGTIIDKKLSNNKNSYTIKAELFADFPSLHHVLVINNKLMEQQLELESKEDQLIIE